MTRAERLFILTALYGIALHTVAQGEPLWLKVLYIIALTGGWFAAFDAIRNTTPTPRDGG